MHPSHVGAGLAGARPPSYSFGDLGVLDPSEPETAGVEPVASMVLQRQGDDDNADGGDGGGGGDAGSGDICGIQIDESGGGGGAQNDEDQGSPLQTKSEIGAEGGVVDPALAKRIGSLRGSGSPLVGAARTHMETAFAHRFEDVRIHDDAESDVLTRQVRAVAFTLGNDIFFRRGAYAPETAAGQRLLAHELTHVLQQRPSEGGGDLTVGAAHDDHEREADVVSARVATIMSGAKVATVGPLSDVGSLGSLTLSRQMILRCGTANPNCSCSAEEQEAANAATDQHEGEDTVSGPSSHSHEPGGTFTCMTCEALRAAKYSPGGAIAYMGTPPSAATVRALTSRDEDHEVHADQGHRRASTRATAGDGGLAPEHAGEVARKRGPALPPPVMVPVSANAGASVVCKNHNSYEVWVNPSEPACVRPCEIKHEQKHIEDFNADNNYKATTKCPSIPDGETFTYASNADAARFECAASDVEIACITQQMATETDTACKAMLKNRRDVTLVNYKKGFGC